MEKRKKEKIELKIEGMSCKSCENHLKKALEKIEGVEKVYIFGWESGKTELITSLNVTEQKLRDSIEEIGYKLKEVKREAITSEQRLVERDVEYDIAIIGTGGAGVAAAIRAAEIDQKVIIVEKGTIGGTCVNIGCVPSKTLIKAAKYKHQIERSRFQGINAKIISFTWKDILLQKDSLVRKLREDKYVNVLREYGKKIQLIQGKAEIVEKNAIKVGEKIIKVKKIIIASGARPKNSLVFEKKGIQVLSSTSAMELEKLPKSLIILGGRAIALELGQMFNRLGVKVTILQRSARIIPEHEKEVSESITKVFQEEGITIVTNTQIIDVYEKNRKKTIIASVDGQKKEFSAEEILVAFGRIPNVEELKLNKVGVKTDKKGFILVDEYMKTSVDTIYAAGDVTILPKFVYVAASAGGIAAENAIRGDTKRLDLTTLPSVIFTEPQIATVGLTEKQAIEKGYSVKTSILPMSYVPHALTSFNTYGLIKLVADRKTDQLVGAHVVAENAGEIIQSASFIISFGRKYGVTLKDITEEFFPYLTQVEGLKLAILAFEKDVEMLSCCAN